MSAITAESPPAPSTSRSPSASRCSRGVDEEDRKKALEDVRAWLDKEDRSISRALFGFTRTSANF